MAVSGVEMTESGFGSGYLCFFFLINMENLEKALIDQGLQY